VEEFYRTTLEVLKELGADQKRMITVFNKVDLPAAAAVRANLQLHHPDAVFLSTHTGEGLERLRERMADQLADQVIHLHLCIPHARGDLIALLHKQGKVNDCRYEDTTIEVEATIPCRLEPLLSAYRRS
jgi:GTP-binding protein HflX